MRRVRSCSRYWRGRGQGGPVEGCRLTPLRQEAAEEGVEIVAQLLDDIATFLDQQHRHIDAADTLADCAEAFAGDSKVCGRIAQMRVEAKRDDQHGGTEPADRIEPALHRGDVAAVLRAGGQREVQVVAKPAAGTRFVLVSSVPGI